MPCVLLNLVIGYAEVSISLSDVGREYIVYYFIV